MTRPTEFAPKKEGNYNVVATWPRHMIPLVILTNNILLSSLIALTYHFVPDSSSFWYTKLYSSIIGNWHSYITLLRNVSAAILFIGKCSFCHLTIILIFTHSHPICWDLTFLHPDPLGLDHPTKSCNWQRPTKQNQPRMVLALGGRDSSSKHKCQALGNLHDEAKDAWHAWRSKV